ncbi:unnamed protein product [Dovyalis caffra]|uniref:DNA-directed primase/polymerase protein n=1 Tax=Dovyalis caffra TaxID=77055 RepID=A0AAV1RT75_9ROSI|nr:unnamed protein product [Dovyalis caffra]
MTDVLTFDKEDRKDLETSYQIEGKQKEKQWREKWDRNQTRQQQWTTLIDYSNVSNAGFLLLIGSVTVKGKNFSQGKQISPVVFYGSPHGVPPKRPISLLRLLHEIRVDLAEQQKSNLSKEVWATFPRQNEAMNFAKEHENVRIFSYQDHHNGQRRFLISTYKEFWERYKNMDAKFRHHYEVIQEGLPCHLYFDLEFNKRDNVERNGDEMVDLLISVILEALLEKYSIQGNRDWIVELDSSTAVYELLIDLFCVAFIGTSRKVTVAYKCTLADKFLYTVFLMSSPAEFSFPICEEDMFMASLICNMDVGCNKLLVCKMDMECMKTLQFDTEVEDYISLVLPEEASDVNNDHRRRYIPKELSLSGVPSDTGKSPFPALEKFIESIASTRNISGKIRSWYWFSEYGLMVYSMSRNRYCERIGREHKSNHGYRSPLRPIPWDVIPDPPFSYDSVQMADKIGSTNNNLEFQYVSNDCEDFRLYVDKHNSDSCSKDSWWLEAIKVADDIENEKKTLDNVDEQDDNWWMAVEETASQSELIHFS